MTGRAGAVPDTGRMPTATAATDWGIGSGTTGTAIDDWWRDGNRERPAPDRRRAARRRAQLVPADRPQATPRTKAAAAQLKLDVKSVETRRTELLGECHDRTQRPRRVWASLRGL